MTPTAAKYAGSAALSLVIVSALCGALFLAYSHGKSVSDAKWQAQISQQKATIEQMARHEEQRRQKEIDEVRQDAKAKIEAAIADAARADTAADRLRQEAKRLAARASQCATDTGTTGGSKAATAPAVVLADVLGRADKRAGELAAAYDRAVAAGLACEAAYDSLRSARSVPR